MKDRFFAKTSMIVLLSALCMVMSTQGYADSGKRLYIANDVGFNTPAKRLFLTENPNVEIKTSIEGYISVNDVISAMVTRDPDIDIYSFSAAGILGEVIQKDYAYGLSSSEIIDKEQRLYEKTIRDMLQSNGTPYAVVEEYVPRLWAVNVPLWERLGLGEYPESIAQWMECLLRARTLQDGTYNVFRNDYSAQTLLYELITLYIAQNETEDCKLSFSTPVFSEFMQALLSLMEGRSSRESLFSYNVGAEPLVYLDALPFGETLPEGVLCFLPPSLRQDGRRYFGADLHVLIVNPFGRQKDLAIAYLECIVRTRSNYEKALLERTLNEAIEYEGWNSLKQQYLADREACILEMPSLEGQELEKIEGRLRFVEEALRDEDGRWCATTDQVQRWREFAPFVRIQSRSSYEGQGGAERNFIIGLCAQCLDGQMGIDDLIRKLDERAEMVWMEGGISDIR